MHDVVLFPIVMPDALFGFQFIKELGAGERRKDGNQDIAQGQAAKEADILLEILFRVKFIAGAQDHIPVMRHAHFVHDPDRLFDLLHVYLFVHAFQDLGNAAFDADGDQLATAFHHAGKHLRIPADGIHPAHAAIGKFQAFLFDHIAKVIHPSGIHGEVVIMKPEIRIAPFDVFFDFRDHSLYAAFAVGSSIKGGYRAERTEKVIISFGTDSRLPAFMSDSVLQGKTNFTSTGVTSGFLFCFLFVKYIYILKIIDCLVPKTEDLLSLEPDKWYLYNSET